MLDLIKLSNHKIYEYFEVMKNVDSLEDSLVLKEVYFTLKMKLLNIFAKNLSKVLGGLTLKIYEKKNNNGKDYIVTVLNSSRIDGNIFLSENLDSRFAKSLPYRK
jgi:hypothetical protein